MGRRSALDVLAGIVLVGLCHVAFAALIYVLAWLWVGVLNYYPVQNIVLWMLFAISLSQLLYVVPLVLWLRRRRRLELAKGVVIGAVITALLNGSCYLIVVSVLRGM